jgi:tRNA pseudouridine38-40 synthase
VIPHGSLILVHITASHFLWNMVRQLVGTLVEVGRGNVQSSTVQQWLRTRDESSRQFTASPSGLFLERVYYKGDKRNPDIRPIIEIR